jgi:hypothetical protein
LVYEYIYQTGLPAFRRALSADVIVIQDREVAVYLTKVALAFYIGHTVLFIFDFFPLYCLMESVRGENLENKWPTRGKIKREAAL